MPAEVFVNVGESTLAAPALSTDPTLTLLSGAPFPAAGQYRIRLDDSLQQPNGIATRYEFCRATFNAGNVINGFRTGVDLEGTTAQGWPIGTKVVAVVTAAALAALAGSGSPYKARAFRYAAFTLSVGSQIVPMDSETYDPNSNFTTGASAHYVCPVAGYYQVNGRAGVSGSGRALVMLYKNGTEYSAGLDSTSSGGESGPVSDVIQCAAGDTLSLWIYSSVAAALDVSSSNSYLSIHYLSS